MKAIQVTYYDPTNHKGTRLKVKAEGCKAAWYSRQFELDYSVDAEARAYEYAKSLSWGPVKLASGVLPNGDYVFVIIG